MVLKTWVLPYCADNDSKNGIAVETWPMDKENWNA